MIAVMTYTKIYFQIRFNTVMDSLKHMYRYSANAKKLTQHLSPTAAALISLAQSETRLIASSTHKVKLNSTTFNKTI